MRIAFLRSRGIPATYSGFETFYEQLAVRLEQRGHHVTVWQACFGRALLAEYPISAGARNSRGVEGGGVIVEFGW